MQASVIIVKEDKTMLNWVFFFSRGKGGGDFFFLPFS